MVVQLVAELAAAQYGVVARFQLLELGVSDSYIRAQLRSGTWVRLAPGVYGFRGHRDTWERRVWIKYLAAGEKAAVSHQTAAASFRVVGFPRRGVHLTVPHPGHQRVTGATVHQSRFLPPHHTVMFNGRQTTSLSRTLVDLAPQISFKKLELAYEHAIVTDHLTYSRMTTTFRELATPGRRGMTKLGRVLDERGPGFVASASELERLVFEVAELAELPAPVPSTRCPATMASKGASTARSQRPG